MAAADLPARFFLALAVIVAAAQGVGWMARRGLRQPQVVGEMIAGILLGPSLLGIVAPRWEAWLFPPELKPVLAVGAQLGVGLYMFVVGLGTNGAALRANLRPALAVSFGGMAAPFAVAALLAPWLLRRPGLFADGVGPAVAALFLGACIAITAFPMLARIIHERGLTATRLGTLALAAGALDDAAAWIVLAIVLATLAGGAASATVTIGGAALFAGAVLGLGRMLLRRLDARATRADSVGPAMFGLILLLFLAAAAITDAIGMHAVFGGFLLGLATPDGRLADAVRRRIEPLTVALLLPMFFVLSGLNTRLDLLVTPSLLAAAVAILAASVLAKAGACWAAARLMGEGQATALGLGALMNARGLMELIIINIGLAHGIIGPPLFAMLAAMAAITTLAAGPLFALAMRLTANDAMERGHAEASTPPIG